MNYPRFFLNINNYFSDEVIFIRVDYLAARGILVYKDRECFDTYHNERECLYQTCKNNLKEVSAEEANFLLNKTKKMKPLWEKLSPNSFFIEK